MAQPAALLGLEAGLGIEPERNLGTGRPEQGRQLAVRLSDGALGEQTPEMGFAQVQRHDGPVAEQQRIIKPGFGQALLGGPADPNG